MNIILSSLDFLNNWARSNSLWPLTFATACCGIEMISTSAASYDIARFGSEVFRATPRQADLIIVAGTITYKMAPALVKLYEQMPEPKYVIAMGVCTCTGGMFKNSSYSVVNGVDRIIPVDVYLPMCPPKPEALLDAIIKLQKKIRTETLAQRERYIFSHRPKVVLEHDDAEILVQSEDIKIYGWGVFEEELDTKESLRK